MDFTKEARDHDALGYFASPGEYMKDFFFLKEGETYHLFYNRGAAGPEQSWLVKGNEDSFGHATSRDLVNWEIHEPVMFADQGDWEEMVISAPCIQKVDGRWLMLYTGFSGSVQGRQTIGMATGGDLIHWKKDPANPVYTGPGWALEKPDGYYDCRDPHFIRYGDDWLLYTSVLTNWNEGAIAIARTRDFRSWEDRGWAFTEPKLNDHGWGRVPESPVVFERDGWYYLLTSQNAGYKTRTPGKPCWERFDFPWPKEGFYAAFEVVQEGDRYIGAAFNWKMNGNFILFWEFDWVDGNPIIDYGRLGVR